MVSVSGQMVPWHEKMTITDLLKKIDEPHAYVVVRINNTYVSRPNFDKTLIPDNSEVFLIPMIAGG